MEQPSPDHEANFPVFGPLVEQLEDDSPAVRQNAAWCLGQLAYTPALRLLARRLAKDDDCLVRLAAAQALAHIGGSASAQALIRGLKDEDDLVRDACVLGLGTMGDTQGLYPLEQMLKRADEDEARRIRWAIEVLQRVDAPGESPDRRRGGVSKKISRYLEKVHADPRDGIGHNNLAVAYFHAAEFELALRHCLLAKELGARVHWLWQQLDEAGHDPAGASLSEEDHRFLRGEGPTNLGAEPEAMRLEPEPKKVDLRETAGKRSAGAVRLSDLRGETDEAAPSGKAEGGNKRREERRRRPRRGGRRHSDR